MSYARDDFHDAGFTFADRATVDARADFIAKTYAHLLGAVLVFCGITGYLINLPGIEQTIISVLSIRYANLMIMGGFILVSFIAESWARSSTSSAMQYAGLSLYVVAEAIIFTPMLYMIKTYVGPNVIPTAAILTLTIFTGLSLVVFLTRKNFSFLAPALSIAGFAALAVVLCASFIPGFSLTGSVGMIFTVLMIVFACGYILYDTSNVLHTYRIGQHVAASLALFASVALLFWYILRLVSSLTSRD